MTGTSIVLACFQRCVMSKGAFVMLHLCEEAIAALHRPWCRNLHSAHEPFNNSFLLIVKLIAVKS